MADIIHRIGIKAPVSKVYAAVATVEGVAGWWTRETSGVSKPDGTITVRFRNPAGEEIGRMDFEVIKLDAEKEVVWCCKAGPEEWVGTEVTFNLSQVGDYTILIFGHRKWKEAIEFTAHCSMKWAIFMLSLKDLVQTGKGKPAPDDIKIDDWN